ncbi:MAG: PEP-CTERM system TPR-repeat protein PrsT, partial [Gammaproteobacteria bacterium]|nr:PEP-CTERM system TPR-repeat protein PrsT [Gammaproteobacteria bacterium]
MTQLRSTAMALLIASPLIGGCDLAVDDATRIERAEQAAAREEYRAAAIELKNVLRSDPANIEARVLLGQISLQIGDAVTAVKQLQRAHELGAEMSDIIVPMARGLLAIGQVDEVLALDPNETSSLVARADLNAILGNARFQKGEIAAAENTFQAALSEQADHPEALVGMARIHVEKGDTKAAEIAVQRVIAQHNDAHAAYAVLGRLQMNNAEYQVAEANFRKAIDHSQDQALVRERLTYLAGLIDVLLVQKKSGEAQDVSTQMLDLAPQHPYALFQAGRADFEAGQMDLVIEKTQRVISAYPGYQPARLLLAAAAMSKENFALAEMHLQSLVNANPDNVDARRLLAQAQMNLGSPDEAFDALEPLLEGGGAVDPRLLAMAGSASLRRGNIEEGLEYVRRSAAAGGDDRTVQIQAAASFIDAGETARAIELLEEMPESMHGDERDFLLILARLQSGDTEGARSYATNIVESRPDDSIAHRIMGGFHMAAGEHEAARRQFEQAHKLDPEDVGVIVNLARLDALAGDLAGAEKRYDTLLAREPDSLIALLGVSRLAEKGGDQQRAVALLETARERNPQALQPLLLLARYYLQTGRGPLAMERAEQAVSIAPENASSLNALGMAQLGTQRYSEALGTFERALEYGPNNVDVH